MFEFFDNSEGRENRRSGNLNSRLNNFSKTSFTSVKDFKLNYLYKKIVNSERSFSSSSINKLASSRKLYEGAGPGEASNFISNIPQVLPDQLSRENEIEKNLYNKFLENLNNDLDKKIVNKRSINKLINKNKIIHSKVEGAGPDIVNNNEINKNLVIGGFNSYSNSACLGNINELQDTLSLKISLENNVIIQLEKSKIYSLILVIYYKDKGVRKGSSISKSIHITKDSNIKYISSVILQNIITATNQYGIMDHDSYLKVYWRKWLNDDEYNEAITPVERENLINEVLQDEAEILSVDRVQVVNKYMNISHLNLYLKEFPILNSNLNNIELGYNKNILNNISELSLNNDKEILEVLNYIIIFNQNNSSNNNNNNKYLLNVYYKLAGRGQDVNLNNNMGPGPGNIELYFVYTSSIESKINRIICVTDLFSWRDVKELWFKDKYPYPRFIDKEISNNKFIRNINKYKFIIEKGIVSYYEQINTFPHLRLSLPDQIYNSKIGVLDFETYSTNENGIGKHSVYSGGWAINNGNKKTYYIDSNSKITNSNSLIQQMFIDIFSLDKKVIHNYTFYAHNLGRFDSIFLIKELSVLGYKISPIWKDTSIIKLTIKDKNSDKKITILDSLNLFPVSLRNLLESFECQITKGHFPHSFVSKDKLNYIGEIPEYKYFNNISELEYLNMCKIYKDNWDLQKECLLYLDSDILGLLEALNKYSEYIYKHFNINITKYNTLPALSMGIFGINFYNEEKNPIKMIKGPLGKFIREAYFGGNVDVFVKGKDKFVDKGYHYDMNSQYPNAMLNKMPTGDPVFSNNKDLNYYFGFVFAKITPPSESVLKNLFIQERDMHGAVNCPRTNIIRWISSEELKQAIKLGYKAEVICGIHFPNYCDQNELFGDYVKYFYNLKANAKNNLERVVAKLMLNSLYGKFGQKEIESRMKVVSKDRANKLIKTHQCTYFSEITPDLILIKYGEKLNEKLRLIYKNEFKEDDDKDIGFARIRGVNSAVQISCMISAYARMSINEFKNLDNNPLIYSDTDSLILLNKLVPSLPPAPLGAPLGAGGEGGGEGQDNIIGNKLGQWKLENVFHKGIFIRSKLYCYYVKDKKYGDILIKKSAGIDSNQLKYENYESLANGIPYTSRNIVFNVNWKNLEIVVENKIVSITPNKS